ncbi:MAG TPA: hypothetical protein VNY05_15020 [Candidatus Acidoferrales bacterium]|nr:hypothetical protein [Candidatus Acidoferrales bacterium]
MLDYAGQVASQTSGAQALASWEALLRSTGKVPLQQEHERKPIVSSNGLQYEIKIEAGFWFDFFGAMPSLPHSELIAKDVNTNMAVWHSGRLEGLFGTPILADRRVYIATLATNIGARLYVFDTKL